MSILGTLQLFCHLSCSSILVPDFNIFSLHLDLQSMMLPSLHSPSPLPPSCLHLPCDLSLNFMVNHFNHFLVYNSLDTFQFVTLLGETTDETPLRPGSTAENGCSKTTNMLMALSGPLKLPSDHIIFSRFIFFPTILDRYFLLFYFPETSHIFFLFSLSW